MKKLIAMLLGLVLMMGCAALAEEDFEFAPMPAEAAVYEGAWQCGRASMDVNWEEEGFRVLIRWGSSAWEHTEWEYSCYYHEDDNSLVSMPFGIRTEYVYGEDGEIASVTDVYDDGEATFLLDEEGCLIWQDEKENAGEGMRFKKLPEEEPLFATVGEAMEAEGFTGLAGGYNEHYAVIVELEGRIIRAVAEVDEKFKELDNAIFGAEDIAAAFDARDEYAKTLPLRYTEEITAEPVDQAELDALVGKTIGEVEAEGFETSMSGGIEDSDVIFTMDKSLFSYDFLVNEPYETYLAHEEEDGDYSGLTVKSARLAGFSSRALDLDYQADGTYTGAEFDETFDGAFDLLQIMTDAIQSGDVDVDTLVDALTNALPEAGDEEAEAIRSILKLLEGSAGVGGEGTEPGEASEGSSGGASGWGEDADESEEGSEGGSGGSSGQSAE